MARLSLVAASFHSNPVKTIGTPGSGANKDVRLVRVDLGDVRSDE